MINSMIALVNALMKYVHMGARGELGGRLEGAAAPRHQRQRV